MLKSLELFGFKSFADRTTFSFADGITGVVGPNGSGKSNVVDAIKWILGDQSAKSLRGKEMADVIFNGSAGRKPSSLAEATLTIDNSSGHLPIESQEVHIGRRLWRSGDAEYLINRAPARLKDVRDLFMGTGAGPSAYCIIEQGRVDQILQANATSRRSVFEEAAGISRYKARRIEAERRLERVDHNLQRLTDIVDEVEAQLNSVRSQAAKAAKYREISEELRELWLGLACDEYRRFSAELAEYERSVADSNARSERLNQQLTELEQHLSELEHAIADVDDRLRDVEKLRAANREQIASHQATIRHQNARSRELDLEIVRLRKQRMVMASRLQEAAAEIELTETQLSRLKEDYKQHARKLERGDEQIRELSARNTSDEARIEQIRARLKQLIRDISEIGNRVIALKAQSETAATAGENAKQRRQELGRQIDAAEVELRRAEEAAGSAGAALADVNRTLERIQNDRESMISERGRFAKKLANRRERRSACQARKAVLEDLENRQEGFGVGVKEILRRARSSSEPPWNKILGTVADLIEADLEHAGLLEVALGDRAQLVVLDDLDPLIEYFKRTGAQIAGRVGFTSCPAKDERRFLETHGPRGARSDLSRNTNSPIEGSRPNIASLPDLTGHAGVQGRAERLVRSSKKAPRLAEHLLADTWVVETLDVALELSRGAGRGCRFVTLQGELLEHDGTLIVGSVRAETAVVSRRSELRQLRNELIELDRAIAKDERRISRTGKLLSDCDEESQAAEADVQTAAERHAACKSQLASKQNDIKRLRRDLITIDEEAARFASQVDQFEAQLRTTTQELADSEENRQALEAEIAEAELKLADSRRLLDGLQAQRTEQQLALAKHEERLNGLQEAHQRMQRDREQKMMHQAEADRRYDAAASKRQEISLHVLNASAALAGHFLQEEQILQTAAGILHEKAEIRNRRSGLLEQENSRRDERRELHEKLHRAEIKIRDTKHQITNLEARTEEEYHLVLSEIVDSGASAVQSFFGKGQRPGRHETAPDADGDDIDTESLEETLAGDNPPGESDSSVVRPVESSPSAGGEIDRQDRQPAPSDETASVGDSRGFNSTHAENEPGVPADDGSESIQMNYDEFREEIEARVKRLRRRLKLIGSVNTDSLRDLDELEKRYGHLSAQLEDLVEAKRALEEIVRRINSESERLFAGAFESIRLHFQDLFRKLFGGGEGDIILEDREDILDCGIDIVARPPGKELRSISLLSGGEKTLTAVALLLSIFKSRPSPFCILDEVDAALDEANIDRFASLLKEFQHSTQFIMVTHSKRTMTVADVLYGVTMEESGISKRMSVRFEDVGENGEFESNNISTADEADKKNTEKRDAA